MARSQSARKPAHGTSQYCTAFFFVNDICDRFVTILEAKAKAISPLKPTRMCRQPLLKISKLYVMRSIWRNRSWRGGKPLAPLGCGRSLINHIGAWAVQSSFSVHVINIWCIYIAAIPIDVVALYGIDYISGVIILAGAPYRSMHHQVMNPLLGDVLAPFMSTDLTLWYKGAQVSRSFLYKTIANLYFLSILLTRASLTRRRYRSWPSTPGYPVPRSNIL